MLNPNAIYEVPKKRKKPFKTRRPECIIGKKVLRNMREHVTNPVFYLIRWKQEDNDLDDEQAQKWINLQRLKYFLDMVERYEIANYDCIQNIDQNYRNLDVDDEIEPDQIIDQACEDFDEKQFKQMQKANQKANIDEEDFIHIPNAQNLRTNNTVTTINVQLQQRYRQKQIQKQIQQGTYAQNDRAENVLNYLKIPQTGKYSFLVTWRPRIDGLKPNPSWVEEDQIKIIQPQFMRQIIREKKLNIEFKE